MKEVVFQRINEITSWAVENGNQISRRMFYDIIRDRNTDISEAETEEAIYEIEQKGILITETDDEDYYGYGKSDNPSFPADVNIIMRNLSLELIISRLKYDEINLNPDFQRRANLWSVEQKSRLIESLMLKIPIPSFYFDASNDAKWIVIDGLQRLSALKGFIVDKNYKLTGLEYLSELEGASFDTLPRIYSRRIMETQLALYTIEKGTPRKIVFNIFKRLNTGGLVLTSQEIRHALNQGEVISLLKNMASCDEFKKATEYSIKTDRMLDCEYATRFLAFTQMDISEYKSNIDDFLDSAMALGNQMSQGERDDVMKAYKRSLDYCRKVFGEYTFRRVNENYRRGPINKALFETFTMAFAKRSDLELDKLVSNKMDVRNKYFAFLDDVVDYLRAGDKYTVSRRIVMVDDFIRELIDAY
ncbi:DUF262 domain-containing protein [Butyrivibrio sp. XPD2002]|uniref:DUF262 domain-containing protein n=1 Tax=Butyrivibrio sp. XPD2002 TaxID=1280665 RepID=UPI00042893BB|nr:DUF262 domain-containing protein [Butyrivibrio sp. XPD2002]